MMHLTILLFHGPQLVLKKQTASGMAQYRRGNYSYISLQGVNEKDSLLLARHAK
jgi:hypothetical protein